MTEQAKLRYDEGCLAAHALNLVGDRWALLVVREILLRPKRFQAIRAGLPGITAAVLTARLHQLIAAGVARHDSLDGTYGVTAGGQRLLPVLQAMCRWGAGAPGHDPRRFISPTALMISMTAMVRGAVGRGVTAGFDMGPEKFVQRLTGDGVLRVEAVTEIAADFTLTGDGNRLAAAVYGPVPLVQMAEAGLIGVGGDAVAAQEFVGLFALR